jgi:hypothetical protein
MLYRVRNVFSKIESTYATDPTPTGTDAVLTSNLSLAPYTGPTVARNLNRATLGGQTVVKTNPYAQLRFDVEVAGSGTATVVPAYSETLRSCGLSVTAASPLSLGQIYAPLSSTFPSITHWVWIDGQKQVINGARGNMSLAIARGEIPKFSFDFMGRYSRPTYTAVLSANVTDYTTPLAVTKTNTPTFTLGGSPLTALKVESFSLNMGNNVVARNIINSEEVIITDRNVTGSVTFEATTTKNWFAGGVESHAGITTLALNLVHGTVSGNIVKISAPAVQITDISETESDGQFVYTCALSFVPVSGNDEFTITTY